MSESFSQGPWPGVVPSYAYAQYSWDANVLAFFTSFNDLAQGYLTWFYDTPLAVYTNPNISGSLLDWTATGIYGVARPILATVTVASNGPLGTNILGTHVFGTLNVYRSGTVTPVSDDIYKRVLTWILYRGDGLQFSVPWLLRRVERFLGGTNGVDVAVDLASRPTVLISGFDFTIIVPGSNPASLTFQQLMAQGFLPTPLPYTFTVQIASALGLLSNGGVLVVTDATGWPTSPSGLSAGALWSNGGVVMVVGPTSPNPLASPVYLNQISAAQLLALGGANLPVSNPGQGSQQIYIVYPQGSTDGILYVA